MPCNRLIFEHLLFIDSGSQVPISDGLAVAETGMALIGVPEHLVSLANGDILFIDNHRCVRKVMVDRGKKSVRTVLGKSLLN